MASANTLQINEGTKLELPLWLAELLAMSGVSADSNKSFISLLEPAMLSSKVSNALKSDPCSVDLNEQSPVFYKMVERWLSIFGDVELAQIITDTVTKRANVINDFANNPRGQMNDTTDFLNKLDHDEQLLYKSAYESAKNMRQFLSKESSH